MVPHYKSIGIEHKIFMQLEHSQKEQDKDINGITKSDQIHLQEEIKRTLKTME